jgi:hypothetical protein
MSKFKIIKRLNLDFLGVGWEKAYITFTPVEMPEIIELTKLENAVTATDIEAATNMFKYAQSILNAHFLEGIGYTGTLDANKVPTLEPITADDAAGELFLQIYQKFLELARGETQPNL